MNFKDPELLSNIDPGGDNPGPHRVLCVGVYEGGGDDPVADGVELLDGGHHGGGVPVPVLVPPRPNRTKALVRDHALKEVLKHKIIINIIFNS